MAVVFCTRRLSNGVFLRSDVLGCTLVRRLRTTRRDARAGRSANTSCALDGCRAALALISIEQLFDLHDNALFRITPQLNRCWNSENTLITIKKQSFLLFLLDS
jgi:hypothetical protein